MYVDQFGISGTGSGAAHGCRISPTRIILLSVVSMGIYWLYGMYRTWKQLRDHNLEQAAAGQTDYPVLHGLTQLVPIYGFFRYRAHIREYKALMQSNLNTYWASGDDRLTRQAHFGKGEIVCIVLGVLFWLGIAAVFVLPS